MTDTYPIRDKNTKPFDRTKLVMGIIIIVLAVLLLKKCGKDVIPPPNVISGEKVHDTIKLANIEKKRLSDSFNLVISNQEKETRKEKLKYDDLMTAYLNVENDLSNVFATATFPDTCKEIVNLLSKKYDNLKLANDKKDASANNVIRKLQGEVSTQKDFLKQKDIDYNKMKGIADTCAKALVAMEKYSKKIQPKNEINIGVEGNSSYINLKPAIGLSLGYRSKTGLQVNATVFSNQTVSIGVRKTLFKFK
jgi:hypothetical protein